MTDDIERQTPIRERCARRACGILAPEGVEWADLDQEGRDVYLMVVDAILTELETPTAAMLEAGGGIQNEPEPLLGWWRRMLAKARE